MRVIEFGADFDRDVFHRERARIWKGPPGHIYDGWSFITRVRVLLQLRPGRDHVLQPVTRPEVEGKVLRDADVLQFDCSVAIVSLELASGYLEPGVPHAVVGGIVTVGARRLGGAPVKEGITRLLIGLDAELTRMFTQHRDRLQDAGMRPPVGPIADVQQVLDLLEPQLDLDCAPLRSS
jgi:hypothetical protein